MSEPNEGWAARLRLTEESLVKQGARLAAERDSEAAKADEQRHLADLGWAEVDKLRTQLTAAKAENERLAKTYDALMLQGAKDALQKYDVCFAELLSTRAERDALAARLATAVRALGKIVDGFEADGYPSAVNMRLCDTCENDTRIARAALDAINAEAPHGVR